MGEWTRGEKERGNSVEGREDGQGEIFIQCNFGPICVKMCMFVLGGSVHQAAH